MPWYNAITNRLPKKLGRFTAAPAAWIDDEYLHEPSSYIGKIASFIKIRLIYTFYFIPMLILDTPIAFIMASLHFVGAIGSATTVDKWQSKQTSRADAYITIFGRSIRALLTSIAGFISPKLIAFYFTPEHNTNSGVHAGGNYYSAADAVLVKPESVEELQTIIQEAVRQGQKIIPKGAGFSQGKQFLPEGGKGAPLVVDLGQLKNIEIHQDDKSAIVGAGAVWSDIQLLADKHRLALRVMQASNVFSVGGSIGTNIHGWDIQNGMLSNVIEWMEIINAKGELVKVTPEDKLFHHITGGLGLFGIVVRAKIKLTDNILLKETGVAKKPEEYPQYFEEQVRTNPNVLHLYRLSLDPDHLLEDGVAVSFVPKEESPKAVQTKNLSVEPKEGTRTQQILVNLARRFAWVRRRYWNGERDRLLANNGPALTTNEVMQPPINAMFNHSISEAEWLQEYFLPAGELSDFLKGLAKILKDNDVPLLNASVRFVPKNDKSPLSYAPDGDRFAVVLCFNQSLNAEQIIKAKKWLRQAQHLTVEHHGSFYLPYQQVSSPEDFAASYPLAENAMAFKQEVDPDGVFSSGFHQKYLTPNHAINHFKEIMKSEDMKKQFAGFLEVVLQRVDTKPFYDLLEDIMQYNDTHEEIYTELCKRLPEIAPGMLGSLPRILGSLSAIKSDLGAQAHDLLRDDIKTIDGLVEIGYPGRFVAGFKQHYQVTGQVVAVYEAPSITDYIQTGFPRAYDKFQPLNYAAPDLSGLADNSADVITCYVGLHHFPQDKLDAFLRDLRRVLRPNGHFILVDHDVTDEASMSMAHMAHMIFNAVNGESVENEMNELRNFQPMTYWQEQLQKHDLVSDTLEPRAPMIRDGDPSRNQMVCFKNNKPVPVLEAVTASQVQAPVNYPSPIQTSHQSANVVPIKTETAKQSQTLR